MSSFPAQGFRERVSNDCAIASGPASLYLATCVFESTLRSIILTPLLPVKVCATNKIHPRDPSNQKRADIRLNLPQKIMQMV
jgi:hypothetical protein